MEALIELLQQNQNLLIISTLILGLMVGSFLNVVIYRLPKKLNQEWTHQCKVLLNPEHNEEPPKAISLLWPGSHCPHCKHEITALQNIPILSYLLLRGQCANCKQAISPRYPIIEAITGLLSGLLAWHFGFSWALLGTLLLFWSLISLTMIDIDHQILPDVITLPLLWIGILFNYHSIYISLQDSILGAVLGYLSLWGIFHLFRLLTGKEGMGYGDFKLLAVLGAWMGWKLLPTIILLSSLVGAVVGIAMILILGRDRQIPIPFGPYLAGAGIIALFQGDAITSAYLNWAGLAY
ncbi:MAG: prepilin peptidase [Gammaproteobacteria bacterium]|nr:prepilin peptidase [Gammaproteobacteria bacterium]